MKFLIKLDSEGEIEKKLNSLGFKLEEVEVKLVEEEREETGISKGAIILEKEPLRAKRLVEKILLLMDQEGKVEVSENAETVNINIEGENVGALIGSKGKTLEALQLLMGVILNKKALEPKRVLVDVSGYRERRKVYLEEMARRIAEKVTKEKKPIFLEPMPPSERRIIHLALQGNPSVRTESEGEEPERKIGIFPVEDQLS